MDRFAVYLVVVAVLCTLISVITEFTKEVGVLKKIPCLLYTSRCV